MESYEGKEMIQTLQHQEKVLQAEWRRYCERDNLVSSIVQAILKPTQE